MIINKHPEEDKKLIVAVVKCIALNSNVQNAPSAARDVQNASMLSLQIVLRTCQLALGQNNKG